MKKRISNRKHGFSLTEVMLALAIFTMMVLMFGATVPALMRSAKYGGDYDQAVALGQHKIEELRASGLGNPDAASLGSLGVIDSPQPGFGVANPSGAPSGAYSYTFTTVDSLTNDFPPGSTGVLTISADPYVSGANDVIVTITWRRNGGPTSSYTAKAKIINK